MSWSDIDDDDLLCAAMLPHQTSTAETSLKTVSKLSKSKSNVSWINSAFEGFDDFGKTPLQQYTRERTKKRPRETDSAGDLSSKAFVPKSLVERTDDVNDLWADKHAPLTVHKLAVHKKKLGEVQDWFEQSFRKTHKEASVLLLTGPSGSGKTACVKALARDMRFELQEWINPLTTEMDRSSTAWEPSRNFAAVGIPGSESQARLFQDFLLRANKYPTLSIFNQDQFYRKAILVEDFPNVFFKDSLQFHEILRHYEKRGQSPLVFIVSDSVAGESNERLLFPKHIQSDLNITNISFNPVAPTSLTKVLSRIAQTEATKGQKQSLFRVPEKRVLECLVTSSAGDIRGAINALQFTCLKGTTEKDFFTHKTKKSSTTAKPRGRLKDKGAKGKKTKTDQREDQEQYEGIGGKDTSLFLFRALGKILYCKRSSPSEQSSDAPILPSHLTHCYRDPLQVNPEEVLEKCHLSSDYFTAYLHQNYLEFYTSIEDVVVASEYVSDSDFLTMDWSTRASLMGYAASVSARGLMYANTGRARASTSKHSGLGWKPLHKPQWYTVNKQMKNNISTARAIFAGECTPTELQTQLIPYMSVINSTQHSISRRNVIREMGRMPKYLRSHGERLDEKDVSLSEMSEIQDTTTSDSHNLGNQTERGDGEKSVFPAGEKEEDEEAVIEDFDD